MASAAAQKYFNSFPPGQQQTIVASWGGADLMDDWFNAAVNAGAVSPSGDRPTSEGATSPTGSTGDFTAAQLRQLAQQQGWSEDFARFNDATLQGWINDYWDPSAQKFRSMRGAEGFWEKPTECPPGMSPGGPSEKDPCIGPGGQTAPKTTGGAGGIGDQGMTGGNPWSPLQDLLANQGGYLGGYDTTRGDNAAGLRGGVVGGGGIWYQPTGSIPAPGGGGSISIGASPKLGGRGGTPPGEEWMGGLPYPGGPRPRGGGVVPPFQAGPVSPRGIDGLSPRSPAPGGFGTNALQQTMTSYQSGVSRPAPLTSALQNTLMPQQQQTSPLTSMLQPYQKKRNQMGSWF